MLELGTKVLLAYLLGSVSGSLLIGKLKGGVDIRELGSGNAGGTNAFRTQGKMFALGVVIIDVGKGYLSAAFIPVLAIVGLAQDSAVGREWLVMACASAVVIGHCYPFWHGFQGGKGAATLIGTLIYIQPAILLPVIAIWVLVVMLSGYVGLATVMAGFSAPVYLLLTGQMADQPLMTLAISMAVFLVYTHRENIRRLKAGTEARVGQLAIFRRDS
ncbi:MAG: glycerol-3-phosphate 1-O-acyltransferase PlsY [Gammaproteobacteria bacterium]|nr:glycerol-3-phosphate 1-O-acyltransferase PlsY [Gammaproteobacteria bacterium]